MMAQSRGVSGESRRFPLASADMPPSAASMNAATVRAIGTLAPDELARLLLQHLLLQ